MKTMMGWLCFVIMLTSPTMALAEVSFCGEVYPDDATEVLCSDEEVSDVSALAGLTKLEALYLSETPVSDVSPLAGLTNLVELDLRGNQVGSGQVKALHKALPGLKVEGP